MRVSVYTLAGFPIVAVKSDDLAVHDVAISMCKKEAEKKGHNWVTWLDEHGPDPSPRPLSRIDVKTVDVLEDAVHNGRCTHCMGRLGPIPGHPELKPTGHDPNCPLGTS